MDIRLTYIERLGFAPRVTNDFTFGTTNMRKETALEYLNIEPNPTHAKAWLVFDLDFEDAAFAWEAALLPPPTITVVNRENGHCHMFYGLKTPVACGDNARRRPLQYLEAVRMALALKLGADLAYPGLLAKNPLHDHWYTIWGQQLYELGFLAEYLTLSKSKPVRVSLADGRNCRLRDELRVWACSVYPAIKLQGTSREKWQDIVLSQAEKLNVFSVPLAFSEVRAIARSVAKYVFDNHNSPEFRRKQSVRGKLGGRPPTTTANGKPWERLGISRSKFYRLRKSGNLPS